MATHTPRILNTYIGLLGCLALVLAVLASFRPGAEKAQIKTIRVAYLPIYVDLPLFVAKNKNYFKDAGLQVKLFRFQTSPDMMAALATNQVDAIASVATTSALAVQVRDPGKFRIFLVDQETDKAPLSSLIIPANSKVSSVQDLKGANIASFPGPTASVFAPEALENLGLERGTYSIHEIPIGDHIKSIQSGQMDAAVTYEPTATQAVMKYGAKKMIPGLIEANVINPWQAGVWIIRTEFAKTRSKETKEFVKAIYKAVEFVRNDPVTAKQSLQEYTAIDLDVAEHTPNIPFAKLNEVDWNTLQKHADLLTRKGVLSQNVDVQSLRLNLELGL